MRSGSLVVAIAVSLGCGAGAVACYVRSASLRTEANWMMARGNAAGAQYAQTLDDAFAERQLASFEARQAVLDASFRWQRAQLLLVMGSVLGGFLSYVLYLLFRLRQQLVAAPPEERQAEG